MAPRWSPDRSSLAFVASRECGTKQLYVIPMAGGEPRRLTSLEEDVAEPVWSPNGERLAFSARVRDPGTCGQSGSKLLEQAPVLQKLRTCVILCRMVEMVGAEEGIDAGQDDTAVGHTQTQGRRFCPGAVLRLHGPDPWPAHES